MRRLGKRFVSWLFRVRSWLFSWRKVESPVEPEVEYTQEEKQILEDHFAGDLEAYVKCYEAYELQPLREVQEFLLSRGFEQFRWQRYRGFFPGFKLQKITCDQSWTGEKIVVSKKEDGVFVRQQEGLAQLEEVLSKR